ncbi:MAG: hypothetical protein VKJ06_03915 [Vampirovibrionales bacterium]|nr:hypothetical protein [Vampirovibrionales bacterium]
MMSIQSVSHNFKPKKPEPKEQIQIQQKLAHRHHGSHRTDAPKPIVQAKLKVEIVDPSTNIFSDTGPGLKHYRDVGLQVGAARPAAGVSAPNKAAGAGGNQVNIFILNGSGAKNSLQQHPLTASHAAPVHGQGPQFGLNMVF